MSVWWCDWQITLFFYTTTVDFLGSIITRISNKTRSSLRHTWNLKTRSCFATFSIIGDGYH